jgi:pilus assembly protein CpaE
MGAEDRLASWDSFADVETEQAIMQKTTVLIVGADPNVEANLRGALQGMAQIVASPVKPEQVADEYRRVNPGVVLVAVSAQTPENFGYIYNVTAAGGVVIVVSQSKESDLILRAMRSGAREFVVDSDADEIQMAVRAQAVSLQAPSDGSVITVFPAKGGVGATMIATNLAGALQRQGMRVCLLDLDFHLGDVVSFMDIAGNYSISDVLSNLARLDRDLLETSMTKHSSGVAVLAQSGKMEESEHIAPADIGKLIGVLRQHYDRVIIDGVRGFDEIALAALDASQSLLMTLTQDVPAVRNAQRCLELFGRLGYDQSKVKLILNRYQKASRITLDVIADTLHVPVAHTISNDFVSIIDAINRGVLLVDAAPRARLTQDIADLASIVNGGAAAPAPQAKGGFLRGLLGRRTANGTT